MDAAQALADLTEISSQVVQVAILDGEGALVATTIADPSRAARFAAGVTKLVAEAESLGQSRGQSSLSQLESSTHDGSVFMVRRGDRLIAATTRPDPTVGLVFYDLKHCLVSMEGEAPGDGEVADGARGRSSRKKADASA